MAKSSKKESYVNLGLNNFDIGISWNTLTTSIKALEASVIPSDYHHVGRNMGSYCSKGCVDILLIKYYI
jgi:hypothetical protein